MLEYGCDKKTANGLPVVCWLFDNVVAGYEVDRSCEPAFLLHARVCVRAICILTKILQS